MLCTLLGFLSRKGPRLNHKMSSKSEKPGVVIDEEKKEFDIDSKCAFDKELPVVL